MSIYFFEINDSKPAIACVGEKLPTLHAARCFALKYAAALICEQESEFWDGEDWIMTVTDANRLALFTITIYAAASPATMPLSRTG
ncbi:hypothetical protein FSB78_09900 [Sphingomonas ginsenosidivorax]|uniref:DUF6894 domain-containing protein n=1 Tax=Sphingomonas ginsenosidivorax TaxID=862135 RepID=A0A5C6UGY6_9SPHN|nr:hypothetical protein [Sphingomonas ginsenosidivorax]TXC71228.1 hypothetical protein FSB78_09900 [Sphingomonas ginsenosidivorax]